MRSGTATAIAVALVGAGVASPVAAKVGDRAWATCVWQTAPVSAANWLKMSPPGWQDPFEGAASLLGLRLSALCGTPAAIELKPNRYYNFKQLASALRSSAPKSALGDERGEAITELCRSEIEADGKPFTYRYDVVRVDGVVRTTTFQQYYSEADGQSLRLPQDLRILPKPEQKVTSTCRRIASNGTLIDA